VCDSGGCAESVFNAFLYSRPSRYPAGYDEKQRYPLWRWYGHYRSGHDSGRADGRTILEEDAPFHVVPLAASLLLSTLAGQSPEQFSFTEDFSFSITGSSALLTIVLAALLEELGWRGYAEDAIGYYFCWWKESLISALAWALWHLPLFFVPGTYHYNIMQQNPLYMANFFVSIIPLDLIVTWVYVKNNRSIFATMIFHFFVNLLQEKIAMTQTTKCVETLLLFVAAAVVVAYNRDLFFETRHIGNLLGEEQRVGGRRTFLASDMIPDQATNPNLIKEKGNV
jgi:membrane protease YdiL (CAAX protease family)